jgi:hypothetical protein
MMLELFRMIIRFSQRWAKEKYEQKIRQLIRFVKGRRSCPDLLIKVFFYKNPHSPMAHYRSIPIHGHLICDQKYVDRGVKSIIMLKFPPDVTDTTILWTFAHEFKHYLDFREKLNKKHYKWWEKRANKFANKTIKKWKTSMPYV